MWAGEANSERWHRTGADVRDAVRHINNISWPPSIHVELNQPRLVSKVSTGRKIVFGSCTKKKQSCSTICDWSDKRSDNLEWLGITVEDKNLQWAAVQLHHQLIITRNCSLYWWRPKWTAMRQIWSNMLRLLYTVFINGDFYLIYNYQVHRVSETGTTFIPVIYPRIWF